MQAASRLDLQWSLGLLGAVSAASSGARVFAAAVVEQLPALVSSELTTLSLCNLQARHRSVVSYPKAALSRADIERFDAHFDVHPLVRYHASHPQGGAFRLSDAWSSARLRREALYNDYYRRIGIDRVVALPLQVDERHLVSVVLNRQGRDFDVRDLALLEYVRPTLARLFAFTVALGRMAPAHERLVAAAKRGECAALQVDGAGIVRAAAPRAVRLLARAMAGLNIQTDQPLPLPLLRWFLAQRDAWGDFSGLIATPLMLGQADAGLHLSVLPDFDAGAAYLILIEVRRTREADADNGRLTARERTVLQWVRAGKANRDIATLLAISHRTVEKHLERIFAKLGVQNRTGAALRSSSEPDWLR